MAYSKVIYNGETLIDLTQDTVDAEHLVTGYTAHDASGEEILGTYAGGSVYQDENGYIVIDNGEQSATKKWNRPSAYPNYDLLDISNEECIFFTYEYIEGIYNWCAFSLTCNGGFTVELGKIGSDGSWTVDATHTYASNETHFEELPTDRTYACYKAYPTTSGNHITAINMMYPQSYNGMSGSVGSATGRRGQKCVERYSNLPYLKTFGYGNCSSLRAETLLSTASVTTMANWYESCEQLEYVSVENFDTSNVTSFAYLFSDCRKIKKLDLSSFNTSKVTNMSYVFYCCYLLEEVDVSSWDTQNVTTMANMFQYCSKLKGLDLSNFETPKLTSMNNMFQGCASLKYLDVSNFDTHSITNMANLFAQCRRLKTLDLSNFDVSKVTDFYYLFNNCHDLISLNTEGWDTSKVTRTAEAFNHCDSLITVDLSDWDFSSCTSLYGMFHSCKKLKTVIFSTDIDTSKVTTFQMMFYRCWALEDIDLSIFDFSSATTCAQMFEEDSMLKNVEINNIKAIHATQFRYCIGVKDFIFNVTSIPTLANVNAFNGCNFTNGARIRFPSSLVATAKAATNWSTYADYIEAIA